MHGFDSVKPILHRSGDKNSQPTDQAFSHLRWHASRLETVTVSTVSELRHLKFLSNLHGPCGRVGFRVGGVGDRGVRVD
jgi:hypothetical protein